MEVLTTLSVMFAVLLLAVVVYLIIHSPFFVVQEQQAVVIERLGRFHRLVGPGLHVLLPFVEQKRKVLGQDGTVVDYVDQKERTCKISTQEVMTKDHIHLSVDAVVHYQITDPVKAVYAVADVLSAIPKVCEIVLREVIGEREWGEILQQRNEVSSGIREHIANVCEEWGITLRSVEFQTITSLGTVNPETPLRDGKIQHVHTYFLSSTPENIMATDHIEVLLRRAGREVLRVENGTEGAGEGEHAYKHMIESSQTFVAVWSQHYTLNNACMQELGYAYSLFSKGAPPLRIALIALDEIEVSAPYAEISYYHGGTREEREFVIRQFTKEEMGGNSSRELYETA